MIDRRELETQLRYAVGDVVRPRLDFLPSLFPDVVLTDEVAIALDGDPVKGSSLGLVLAIPGWRSPHTDGTHHSWAVLVLSFNGIIGWSWSNFWEKP